MIHLPSLRIANLFVGLLVAWLSAVGRPGLADDIYLNSMKISRILFLGNSITLHGPLEEIGWLNNCGMAATAEQNDYVHRTLKAIADKAGAMPETMVVNVADAFERTYLNPGYDVRAALAAELAFAADVVVVQLGENMPPLETEESETLFADRLGELLDALADSSRPEVFITGGIMIDENKAVKDQVKQQAAAAAGAFFIDFSDFDDDPLNFAASEGVFSHPGVAAHPGDRGMGVIADGLYSSMLAHSVPEPSSLTLLAVAGLALAALAVGRQRVWTALLPMAALCIVPAIATAADQLDEAAVHRHLTAAEQPPFSFVYGGRHSSELIGKWQRSVEEKTIDAARLQRIVTFDDPETQLQVRAVFTIYTDTPAVEWTLYFTNRGTAETPILEQLQALDAVVDVPPESAVALHRSIGSYCQEDDWLPISDDVPLGKEIAMAPEGGRPSNKASPFFDLQWNTGGAITAVGWSGQWQAKVRRDENGSIRTTAGMQFLHTKLLPGETIRSPRILQLFWSGEDVFQGYNRFRRMMFAHILPRIDGQLVAPPVTGAGPLVHPIGFDAEWARIVAITEADTMREIEYAKQAGFEYFWLDAYFTRDSFASGMGNYGLPVDQIIPDPVRFPHGIKPISDAAHQAGMKFVLWFEPERVHENTHIRKNHLEMTLAPPKELPQTNHLFNLGDPKARQYITEVLSAAIRQWNIDCLRIDYNIDPLCFWQEADRERPDRVGITEIRYVEGLYQMWDDLLKAHPNIFIDNCASGGRRIDLETCSRSIPLWRTDATIFTYMVGKFDHCSIQNQTMTAGLNRYVPYSISGQGGQSPYHVRSGMNAGVVFGDIAPEDKLGLLRQGTDEVKRLRKYFFGDFYVLSSLTTSPKDWCVTQYHRPSEQDGIVLAFRRHESPDADFSVELREIDPSVDYEAVFAYSYDRLPPRRIKGANFRSLKLHIEDCPGSVVVEYRKAAL